MLLFAFILFKLSISSGFEQICLVNMYFFVPWNVTTIYINYGFQHYVNELCKLQYSVVWNCLNFFRLGKFGLLALIWYQM